MILIDKALENCALNGTPVRAGVIGTGYIGSHLAARIEATAGLRLQAACGRDAVKAKGAMAGAGVTDPSVADSRERFDTILASGGRAACSDPSLICRSPEIDVVVEATGTVEYGAAVALEAIRNGKHIVLCNAELHGTVGPILKRYADEAGVVLTDMDGDQPGVTINLYRQVRMMGFRPVLCGNIKGLLDHYRTPATQAGFAEKWGQSPKMVTSFADGTKIAFEQAVTANAVGMGLAVRGMLGPAVPEGERIENAAAWYPPAALESDSGIVDYVVGAWPPAGVFVIAKNEDPANAGRLALYKLGDGPYYVFYTPTHLCSFETVATIARAHLFRDAAVAPAGRPIVGVMTSAKADMRAGTVLDGIGGFHVYGLCESAETMLEEGLLPIGLSEGCLLTKDIPKDAPIRLSDVARPAGRLCDRLYGEQCAVFFGRRP